MAVTLRTAGPFLGAGHAVSGAYPHGSSPAGGVRDERPGISRRRRGTPAPRQLGWSVSHGTYEDVAYFSKVVSSNSSRFRELKDSHVQHQAGGLHCTQVELLATELTAGLLLLADRFADTNLSGWGTIIDDLVGYREALRELVGVDCALSYRDFREAVYPVDVTLRHLQHLIVDKLPERLDDLLEVENPTLLALGMLDRWRLWLIAENSD